MVALQPWLVKWPPHYKLVYKVVCTCVQDEDVDDIKTAISKFPMEYAGDELYAVFMENPLHHGMNNEHCDGWS